MQKTSNLVKKFVKEDKKQDKTLIKELIRKGRKNRKRTPINKK